MQLASIQLTKITDVGCSRFLCIFFLLFVFFFLLSTLNKLKVYSTNLLRFAILNQPVSSPKLLSDQGGLFFIAMKCSFPCMVWLSHEFSYAKVDNLMSIVKWSQVRAFIQFCFPWNLLLNLALSFHQDFCLCGNPFSRYVSAGSQ